MSFSESNRLALYYKAETVWGETPAGGAFKQLRFTGESLDYAKQTARSATIRADRMTDDLAVLGVSTQGDVNFELAYSSWDDFIEAVLGGTWSTFTSGALTISIDAAAKTATRSAGSFITDGVTPGCTVKFTGYVAAGNNARFVVASLTATVLTLQDPNASLVTEAGTGDETFAYDYVKNGVVRRSFAIEKQWTDLGKYQWFNGLRASSWDLDVTALQLIKGKFAFMGKDAKPGNATVTGSLTPAGTNPIMSASANVGALALNGVALSTGLKSIKFTASNNLRKQEKVGQSALGGVGYGDFDIKGTIEAYFEDTTLLLNMINHDTVALSFSITDPSGNVMNFVLPAVKLTTGSPMAGGANQDIMIPLQFESIRDAASNCMLAISRV